MNDRAERNGKGVLIYDLFVFGEVLCALKFEVDTSVAHVGN